MHGDFLTQQGVQHPAAAGVRPGPAAVIEDCAGRGSPALECVSQRRHGVEPTFAVDRLGLGDGGRARTGQPRRIKRKGDGRIAEHVAEQMALGGLLGLPDGNSLGSPFPTRQAGKPAR